MTGHRTVAVHSADRLVTGSLAVVAETNPGAKSQTGEGRVLSKIKGDGTADARCRCLHVNGYGTPRPGAIGEVFPGRWRWLVPGRAVYAGLRWATRNYGHG